MNYILSEGYKIYVTESSPVLITKSIADILDPASRKRDYSKEIILEGTAENLKFFRGYFSFTSTSDGMNFDATKKIRADYYSDNNNIFSNCFLMLNKVVQKENRFMFSVNLFSELKNVFLELKKHDVNSLDYSDMTHTFGKSAIKSSWDFNGDYVYSLIDAGDRDVDDTWRTIDFHPYVKVKRIINEMLIKIGVDPTSFVFASGIDDLLKVMLYGFGGGERAKLSPSEIASRLVDVGGSLKYTPVASVSEQTLKYIKTNLGAIATDSTVSNPILQYSNYEIVVAKTGRYKITLGTSGTVTFPSGGNVVFQNRTRVWVNGSAVSAADDFNYNFNFTNTIDLDLNSGDLITFTYIPMAIIDPITFATILATDVDLSFVIKLESIDSSLVDGATVNVGDYIPSMNCADFLNGIIMIFNLYLTDLENDTTQINSLSKFYKPASSTSENLEELVDYSEDIELIPLANQFAKKIHFKYKENKDYENQTYFDKFGVNYGDLTIENQSEFATGEKVFQLPFGNVIPSNSIIGVDAVIPRFVTSVANSTFKPNKGAPRIAFHSPIVCNFKLADDSGGAVETITNSSSLHHFLNYLEPTYDLNFTLVQELYYDFDYVTIENIYNENYREFIEESTNRDSRLLKMSVNYNQLQVKNLDFRELRYYKGNYYRLNKLEDFNGNADEPTSTRIELVKVLEPIAKPIIKFTPVLAPKPLERLTGSPVVGSVDLGSITSAIIPQPLTSLSTDIYTSGDSLTAELMLEAKPFSDVTIRIYNTGSFSIDVTELPAPIWVGSVPAGGFSIFEFKNSNWKKVY